MSLGVLCVVDFDLHLLTLECPRALPRWVCIGGRGLCGSHGLEQIGDRGCGPCERRDSVYKILPG